MLLLGGLLPIAGAAISFETTPSSRPRGAPDAQTLAWRHFSAQSQAALATLSSGAGALPPPSLDTTDLQFAEFFGPIGDRGLDYSTKVQSLAGHRVRLVGHMVRENGRAPGLFILTGRPLAIDSAAFCTPDDLPPAAVHVHVPAATGRALPFRPGLLVLLGRLEIGSRAECDGRNSVARLFLDDVSASELFGFAAAAFTLPTIR